MDNRIHNKRTLSLHCIYKLMNTIATHKLSPQMEMLVAGAISQELALITKRNLHAKHGVEGDEGSRRHERRTITAS